MLHNYILIYIAISCFLGTCEQIDKQCPDLSLLSKVFSLIITIVGTPFIILIGLILRRRYEI